MTQTAESLGKVETEKEQALAGLGDDNRKLMRQVEALAAERDDLNEKVEGKLVLDPYWQWIFGAVVGLGALGWGYARFWV